MKRALILAALVVAAAALGQTLVKADQGKPGTQGPWPVSIIGFQFDGGITFSGGSIIVKGPDGGAVIVQGETICSSLLPDAGSPQQVTSVGTSATLVPAQPTTTRVNVTVCNSSENSGTPLVKCLYNNVSPVMGVANKGDVLGVSDCIQYNINGVNQLKCISDTASTAVTSNECIP
jgi:hypothetical protein